MSLLLALQGGGPTASQPWLMWAGARRFPDDAQQDARPAVPSLHLYRPGYQTVGQGLWSIAWRSTQQQQDREQYESRSPVPTIHQWRTGYQTVGQGAWPLYWTSTRQQQDAETFDVRSPAPTAHLWRVGYQTVGQPLLGLLYQPPRPRPELEDFDVHRLYWYRNVGISAQPGQPWNLLWWKTTREQQREEPYEVRSARSTLDIFFSHGHSRTIWDQLKLCVNAQLIARTPIIWKYDQQISYGYTVRVSPPSGAVIPQWNEVILVASLGPSLTPIAATATVPNVVGLNIADAYKAIYAAGLPAGEVVYVFGTIGFPWTADSTAVTADSIVFTADGGTVVPQTFNTVIYQTPAAGAVVTVDNQVFMTVSLGDPSPVPMVIVP